MKRMPSESRITDRRAERTLAGKGSAAFLSVARLVKSACGSVKIAFDDKDRYVIVEVFSAKFCRRILDMNHEVLSRQRRTTPN